MIKKTDEIFVRDLHKHFCKCHNIIYPFHSSSIRGKHTDFGWLRKEGKEKIFLSALDKFIISLSIIVVGCVLHSPGYFDRYSKLYKDRL